MAKQDRNRYVRIIEWVFLKGYVEGAGEVPFDRVLLEDAAKVLGVDLPKNLGDNIYSFRHRVELPESIRRTAPSGKAWIIRGEGRGKYRFVLAAEVAISPNPSLSPTRIPDSTPGLIEKYALGDEQALLAKLRYNRLIDTFLGITCYSLQNHLRTTVRKVQIEIDELYIGLDHRGAHYVVPVQAKGGRDRIGVVQIEQDIGFCEERFPHLVCRPVAAQFLANDTISLFELTRRDGVIRLLRECHYQLIPADALTVDEIVAYSRG